MPHHQISNMQTSQATEDEGASKALWRFPLILPLAGLVTLGLTLSMANLISTEFQPQDKSETLAFEINPVDDIVEPRVDLEPPELLEPVETPPAPPTVNIDAAVAVKEPTIKIATQGPIIELPPLDFGKEAFVPPDTNEQPTLRVPPIMPARFQQGDHSGYCDMRFSVSGEGQPYDVTITRCTHSSLESPSKKAVLKWKYKAKIRNGLPVAREGVETKIKFNLADERGEPLPLPSGY